ncbi:MAG: hypothetical protein M3R63_11730, partial [Actinomycetota bacterium]|nr:hypothetical protein [Actinomycetota bacterium]
MSDLEGPAHRRSRPGAVRVADMLAAHGRAAPRRRGARIALFSAGGAAAVATVIAVAVSGPSPATAPATGGSGSPEAGTGRGGPVTLTDISRPAIPFIL